MIGIVDYGAGNLTSVANAFSQLGLDAVIVRNSEEAASCERLVLPGVGSFAGAMQALDEQGWASALRTYAGEGRPLLGICLGMQLLLDRGTEHRPVDGLGLVPGTVVPLEPGQDRKVPHVGWNNLEFTRTHPVFDRVKPHVDFYFVHSFQCRTTDENDVVAQCEYGQRFAACIGRDNVVGVQFHPEKSQPAGLRILGNFADWDGMC